jgi:hypothetical protein
MEKIHFCPVVELQSASSIHEADSSMLGYSEDSHRLPAIPRVDREETWRGKERDGPAPELQVSVPKRADVNKPAVYGGAAVNGHDYHTLLLSSGRVPEPIPFDEQVTEKHALAQDTCHHVQPTYEARYLLAWYLHHTIPKRIKRVWVWY